MGDRIDPIRLREQIAEFTATVERLHTTAADAVAGVAQVVRERDALRAEVEKLRAFKSYVHSRLDDAGVPVDPPGPHRDAGCRIGQRLDVVLGALAASDALLRRWAERHQTKDYAAIDADTRAHLASSCMATQEGDKPENLRGDRLAPDAADPKGHTAGANRPAPSGVQHGGTIEMGDGASGNSPAPVCREAETAASPVEPGVDTGTVAAVREWAASCPCDCAACGELAEAAGLGPRTHAEVSRDLLALKEPAGFLAVPGRAPAPSGGEAKGEFDLLVQSRLVTADRLEKEVKRLRGALEEIADGNDDPNASNIARAALDGGGHP